MAQKKRIIKFGFIFWIAFILLVLLLFFINKDNIKHVLESTNIPSNSKVEDPQTQIQKEIERINKEETEVVTITEPEKKVSENMPLQTSDKTPETSKNKASESIKSTELKTQKVDEKNKNIVQNESSSKNKQTLQKDNELKVTKTEKTETSTKTQITKKNELKKAETKQKTRVATIYFVTIDSDGRISRVASKRELDVSDSPMSDALKSLFAGTTKSETQKSYRSLIPPETKLLGATVRDGIAYINISESFEFNRYGIEGYLAELAQVVFTATEFPTVNSVQFLIEGRKKNYLGSDGVWIGSPLSRNSF